MCSNNKRKKVKTWQNYYKNITNSLILFYESPQSSYFSAWRSFIVKKKKVRKKYSKIGVCNLFMCKYVVTVDTCVFLKYNNFRGITGKNIRFYVLHMYVHLYNKKKSNMWIFMSWHVLQILSIRILKKVIALLFLSYFFPSILYEVWSY